MKTYIATVLINVSDQYKMKRVTPTMIKRYVKEKIRIGCYDDVVFRERICIEVKDVKCDVLEVSK